MSQRDGHPYVSTPELLPLSAEGPVPTTPHPRKLHGALPSDGCCPCCCCCCCCCCALLLMVPSSSSAPDSASIFSKSTSLRLLLRALQTLCPLGGRDRPLSDDCCCCCCPSKRGEESFRDACSSVLFNCCASRSSALSMNDSRSFCAAMNVIFSCAPPMLSGMRVPLADGSPLAVTDEAADLAPPPAPAAAAAPTAPARRL